MKTIKEQYRKIVSGWNDERTENVSNKCVEIAEDFAVEFVEWFYHHGIKYCNPDPDEYFNMNDILQLFKKEMNHDNR
jgi:hypothetical protein